MPMDCEDAVRTGMGALETAIAQASQQLGGLQLLKAGVTMMMQQKSEMQKTLDAQSVELKQIKLHAPTGQKSEP